MAAGDMNGDQMLDLIVSSRRNIGVLLGDGAGGFGPVTYFPLRDEVTSVALGDFNLDNRLDVAASVEFGTVSVLLGDGRGGLGTATDLVVGDPNWTVAVGDFNLDRKPDLAVSVGNAADVLLGDGRGSFGPAKTFLVGDSVAGHSSLTVEDFNLDGVPDLAVSSCIKGNDVAIVLLGDGQGNFGGATETSISGYDGLIAADFNQDGKPDLASFGTGDVLDVVRGDGRGGFGPAAHFPVKAGTGDGLAVGDFNGDRTPDILASSLLGGNGYPHSFNMLLGNGLGNFSTAVTVHAGLVTNSPIVGDFNGDQKPDFAMADHLDNQVIVFLNRGGTARP